MNFIKYSTYASIVIVFFFNIVIAQQPIWPVNLSVPNHNHINCTFAEKHSQFHGAIDFEVMDFSK